MRFARHLVALFVAMATALVVPSAAQAYPDGICQIQLSTQTATSGDSIRATLTSDGPADLSLTFRPAGSSSGETVTRANATTLTATFTAPQVASSTRYEVVGGCSGESSVAAVTINPAGGNGTNGSGPSINGILPDTGGPTFWLLILGALLVIGGGVVALRRRQV